MGESFEKSANTALGNAKGGTAIAIKLLAQKLDEMNAENIIRHDTLLTLIKKDKEDSCDKCKECKTEVDAKFLKLKPVLFIMEYPVVSGMALLGLIIYGLIKIV